MGRPAIAAAPDTPRRDIRECYEKLPPAIRSAVIKAAKAELRDRIKRLDRISRG
jgi:hypothetical protein